MQERTIVWTEIQAGDRIRITNQSGWEMTGEAEAANPPRTGRVASVSLKGFGSVPLINATITLIDRAVKMPTEPGAYVGAGGQDQFNEVLILDGVGQWLQIETISGQANTWASSAKAIRNKYPRGLEPLVPIVEARRTVAFEVRDYLKSEQWPAAHSGFMRQMDAGIRGYINSKEGR